MSLIKSFNIKNKDIITIVGAGGKTSLMFSASSFLRKDYKVLVTTTTNIYVPDDNVVNFDELCTIDDEKKLESILKNNKNGVYVIGSKIINKSGKAKLKGLDFQILDKMRPFFDIILIEGDGSKEKPLKGWTENEPVVFHKSTKVIGVVDITSIGLKINEDNIHRLEKFIDIIDDKESKRVKLEHLKDIVLNEKGLFKISEGEKILFINKVENSINKENSINMISKIKNKNSSYIDTFVYGSVGHNKFSTYD